MELTMMKWPYPVGNYRRCLFLGQGDADEGVFKASLYHHKRVYYMAQCVDPEPLLAALTTVIEAMVTEEGEEGKPFLEEWRRCLPNLRQALPLVPAASHLCLHFQWHDGVEGRDW